MEDDSRKSESHRKKHKHRDHHRHEKRNSHKNETKNRKCDTDRIVHRNEEFDRKHSDTLNRLHDRHTDTPYSTSETHHGHKHYGDSSTRVDHYNSKHLEQDKYSRDSRRDDGDEDHEYNFNFSAYKSSLNRIFFRDDDVIKKGTKEYEEFWSFLEKYQAFQRKKAQNKNEVDKIDKEEKSNLDLPRHYDKRYRIGISFICKNYEQFIKKGRLIDADIDRELTINRVKQFRNILLHYVDFLQKQKFAKLKKIRQDQENLPIFQYKKVITDMVKEHNVVVVAGDTGCGKSTQVPQYLLESGFTNIACTQPRRIACISLSKRVGYETLQEYGSEVAYQVRFEKTKTRTTKILFLTEGLLLRQMTSDPYLKQYSVIVIDEVHERHIHTDFLLGVLKCLLQHRDDLKLVLMSATINIHLFSGYFDNCPVVKVPGRLYPIELEYCPIKRDFGSKSERLDPSPYLKVMQMIDHKFPATERGDLLVFLSGMSEIMAVVEAAKIYAQNTKRWIVLPLHSALSITEQDKVFDIAPEGVRKCIVSTNIAETSVTIDGVRFIVDSGKVKEMSFDPKFKMQRLQEFWISRASAEQRKGRAGRTGPGYCYRLYDESDYNEFQDYSTPEIQRVPLDSLVLQMISMGLPDARKFPFLEAPSLNSIENSIIFLKDQGAVSENESLTPIGQMLSRLPVDVVIGKMLIMGSIFHMIDPVLSIAAAMSVQSPFTSHAHTDHDAIASRKPLESDHGDPFTLLNAFDEWIQVKAEGRGTRKWCKRRALEEQRFYEMTKLKQQFKELLQDHNLLITQGEKDRYYTNEERRQRHGERKRLGELKREQRKESKRRKILKLEDEEYTISDGEDDDKGHDIKDLEFRLSHDLNKLQEISNKSRSFTLRDINLLKIILCSGLYPQVAIPDDCNSYKTDSEQVFHTKNKAFILLHPTSVFSCQPEFLQTNEKKEYSGPSELKGKLSNKHQLLAFVSLLETNKPYLVNLMRVPALQTVTLFSNYIDTNADCTRIVCDGWLELRFTDSDAAEQIMSSVIQLRATWQNLLKLRLEDTFQSMEEDKKINPRAKKLEKVLGSKLTEFLCSDVAYSIRRILSAEMQYLYKGTERDSGAPSAMFMDLMDSDYEAKTHPIKGGIQINDYLTHDCLIDDASATVWGEYTPHMQKHWTCPRCKSSMIVNVLERLQHESQCQNQNIQATKDEEKEDLQEEKEASLNPLRKSYFCSDCDKQYNFTMTEILKHKKTHSMS